MPTSLGLALSVFPAHQRGTAVGVWAAVGGVAAGFGPILGGLLVEWNWRWIFLINVPLVLAALIAGAVVLPRQPGGGNPRRADMPGALLVMAAIGLIIVALAEARGWPTDRTWMLLGAGLAVSAVFVIHIRRRADPVVSPRLFAARSFSAGAAGLVA